MGRIGLDQDLSTHHASEVGLLCREDLNLKEYRVTIHRLKNAPTNWAMTSYTLARSEGDRTPNALVRRATILPVATQEYKRLCPKTSSFPAQII
jgi:hypothetical protein